MKKLFTVKNILIVSLLLGIVVYLITNIVSTTSIFDSYNDILNQIIKPAIAVGNAEQSIIDAFNTYSNASNQSLVELIFNYVIIACIGIFLVLFFSKIFNKYNCLKAAAISLMFIGFAVYMLQIAWKSFLEFNYSNRGYSLAMGLASLLALTISIACYVYLLVREIQKRKRATQAELQEPIAEETTQN